MSEFKKGAASLLRSRGLYIALALCLVAAGTVGYLTTLQRPAVQTVVPEEVEVEIIKPPVTVPEIKKPLPAAPVITPVEEETVPVSGPEELLPQVVSPLDGTTVTVFSMTELMYDDTMADWRTHNGLVKDGIIFIRILKCRLKTLVLLLMMLLMFRLKRFSMIISLTIFFLIRISFQK